MNRWCVPFEINLIEPENQKHLIPTVMFVASEIYFNQFQLSLQLNIIRWMVDIFFLLFIILFCTVLIGWNTLYQLQVCVSSLTSNIDQVKFMVIMTCEEHQSMMKNYETARTFKWIYAARKEFFRFFFVFVFGRVRKKKWTEFRFSYLWLGMTMICINWSSNCAFWWLCWIETISIFHRLFIYCVFLFVF